MLVSLMFISICFAGPLFEGIQVSRNRAQEGKLKYEYVLLHSQNYLQSCGLSLSLIIYPGLNGRQLYILFFAGRTGSI